MLWYILWEFWLYQSIQLYFLQQYVLFCGFHLYVVWCNRLVFHMSVLYPMGLVILERRKLYLIQKLCFPHFSQICLNSLEKYLCQNIYSFPQNKCLHSCANPVSGWMTALICSFLGKKFSSGVSLAMWLAASTNIFWVGYQYSGAATSIDLPVKLKVA